MRQIEHQLSGYISDLPTPFDARGEVDLAAFERQCERQIAAGLAAIVVGETAGEASTLSPDEHDVVVRMAVKVARGRIQVIAGAGSNSTAQAIELTRRAAAEGADAILSVVPYYNKPIPVGICAHFAAIAEASTLPIIVHDAPARTLRELTDDTVVQLAGMRRIVGLMDATGNVARMLRLRARLPVTFGLLSGSDATALSYFIHGGDGCISVTSNVVPDICQRIYRDCQQGAFRSAGADAIALAPLTDALLRDATAAPLKYALSLLGLMAPAVRLPLVAAEPQVRAEIASALVAVRDASSPLYEVVDAERAHMLRPSSLQPSAP